MAETGTAKMEKCLFHFFTSEILKYIVSFNSQALYPLVIKQVVDLQKTKTTAYNLGMAVINRLLEKSTFLPLHDPKVALLFECPTEESLWKTVAEVVSDLAESTSDVGEICSCLQRVHGDEARMDAVGKDSESEAGEEGGGSDSISRSRDDGEECQSNSSSEDSSSGQSSGHGSLKTNQERGGGDDTVSYGWRSSCTDITYVAELFGGGAVD